MNNVYGKLDYKNPTVRAHLEKMTQLEKINNLESSSLRFTFNKSLDKGFVIKKL